MTLELINPDGLPKPANYAQVVAASGSRIVFVAGLGAYLIQVVGDRVADASESDQLPGRKQVDETTAHGRDMMRCSSFDRLATSLGEPDRCAPSVISAGFAIHQPTLLHPADVMSKPTGRPLEVCTELGSAPWPTRGLSER